MEELIKMLQGDCRGVVRSADGEVREFRRHGVIDLVELLQSSPKFLKGASVADTVVGRGAALLFAKGHVTELHAKVISEGAVCVLRHAGVNVSYDTLTPHILNRRGDGHCPIEWLTNETDSPNKAFELIKSFIEQQKLHNLCSHTKPLP